ncbi:GNAT family protein [Agrococcus sp. 1P02AA]
MVSSDRPEILDVPVLAHPLVTLEPLGHAHADALVQAAAEGELWQRARFTTVPPPEVAAMRAEIDRRRGLHAAASMVPWAVVVGGRAVGMTTYMHIDAATPRLEIGSTWIAIAHQGTGVNAAMKLLLLERAFDRLGCVAVELRTHARNEQSRAAIERLGAHQDGILRSHVLHRGVLRDTVVSSILAAEWPDVRAGLVARLDARARAASGEN